jgi:hypothetical protein
LARKKICVPNTDGGWDMQDFTFWCPMLLAGIKSLVDTVQDRSIVLRMQKAKPGELKHRLVDGTSPTFEEIARKLARWAKDLPELDLDPEVPGFLHNREADLWRPLFAIAALAGGGWPARVEAAAKLIYGQRAEDEVRLALLLEAIQEVFGESERVFADDLVARLIDREGEPWATVKRNGQPLDGYYLRGMLKGVVARDPKQREKERGTGRDRHYYIRADFEEAWARYIPRDPENDPAHPAHPAPEPATPGVEPGSVGPDQNEASGPNQPQATETGGGAGLGPDGAVSSGPVQDTGKVEEIDAGAVGPDGPDQIGPDANTYGASGPAPTVGEELDRIVEETAAGARCGYCRTKLNGGACITHDGKTFHADACLAEYLKRRPTA